MIIKTAHLYSLILLSSNIILLSFLQELFFCNILDSFPFYFLNWLTWLCQFLKGWMVFQNCVQKDLKTFDLRKMRLFKGPRASSVYETWEERPEKYARSEKILFWNPSFKKKRENVSRNKTWAEKFMSSLVSAHTRWFCLLLCREWILSEAILRFAVPHEGYVLKRKLLLNSQNDCRFSCHFSFCCFLPRASFKTWRKILKSWSWWPEVW